MSKAHLCTKLSYVHKLKLLARYGKSSGRLTSEKRSQFLFLSCGAQFHDLSFSPSVHGIGIHSSRSLQICWKICTAINKCHGLSNVYLNTNKHHKFSVSCPAGSYFSLDLADCQECSGNTVSSEGADVCTACNEGYDSVASRTKCGRFCVYILPYTFIVQFM